MLATERHWGQTGARPFLPRALSVAEAAPTANGIRLDFLIEGIGPGTDRLCELSVGERLWLNGPLGNSFSLPRELHQIPTPSGREFDAVRPAAPAGAILVGGGIGVAPLALLRHRFAERNVPTRVLLGFRDADHSGGLDELFSCYEVRLASDDGHIGHHGYVTDLLAAMLEGDDAASAAVYACGPPPMLEAVGGMCLDAGVPCEVAMESPMACGFGACFGCAVPKGDGSYLRLCVDGPVLRGGPAGPVAAGNPPPLPVAKASSGAVPPTAPPAGSYREGGTAMGDAELRSPIDFCGIELKHPVINASGTFDAIAARRVYGDALLEHFPFSAFVSKTITPEPRAGNEPQRIWETPAGMINSIGLPNKGLEGFLAEEADAQRRQPGRRRRRRRTGWRERRLADQHAEGERDRSGHRATRDSRRARGAFRAGGAAGCDCPAASGPRRRRHPGGRHGWDLQRRGRAGIHRCGGDARRRRHRELSRSAGGGEGGERDLPSARRASRRRSRASRRLNLESRFR